MGACFSVHASVYLQHTLTPPKPLFCSWVLLRSFARRAVSGPCFAWLQASYKPTRVSGKIAFKYNTMCYFVSVPSFTSYIIFFTFRVRVSVRVRVRVFRVMVRVSASVRLRCRLANKVSVRCVYRSDEQRDRNFYRTVRRITSAKHKWITLCLVQ